MTNSALKFEPNWVSPPGETIADFLEERGWSQNELSKRTGYSRKHINKVIGGEAPIGEDMALKLESVTGAGAHFWLERESNYREALARRTEEEYLKENVDWLSELPVSDMIKFEWILKRHTKWEQVKECLSFFGVASRASWNEQYSFVEAAFRKSLTVGTEHGPTVAWLRKGEIEAQRIDCQPYSADKFESSLYALRSLTLSDDPAYFCERLISICAECGVAVVFVPTPRKCPASGATKWLSRDKALLMLSVRYKTDDHLWFSFFHEAAHIVLHAKRTTFFELKGLDTNDERSANEYAANILIPKDKVSQVLNVNPSYADVTALAKELGVSPGIVVGYLQHNKVVPWTHLNKCKVRYKWVDR